MRGGGGKDCERGVWVGWNRLWGGGWKGLWEEGGGMIVGGGGWNDCGRRGVE